MATHFSILAWIISRAEEPGGLQSMGSQRVGHDLVVKQYTHVYVHILICRSVYSCACIHNSSHMFREFLFLSFSLSQLPTD